MVDFQIIPRAEASVVTLMKSIDRVIINPIIFFLFALAMVYFLYGLAQYLLSPDNEQVHKKSKSVMLYGVIGLFVMVAVFGIMKLILGTVGENKIKINSNGDYVVDGGNLSPGKDIKDNANSNQDFFKPGSVDVSIQDVPQLAPEVFTTDPFPTYASNAQCWHQAVYDKANTEYDALQHVKNTARSQYLFETGTSSTDKNNLSYPLAFDTKIIYDKANKVYHAWMDARAPIKGGTDSNCNLKVTKPARTIPDGATVINVSAQNTPDLPPETFTTDPFPKYELNALCWHKPLFSKASTEFEALQIIKDGVRDKFLKDNGISDTDENNKKYPTTYDTKVLYDKKNKLYYYWYDVRAPILSNGGTDKNCDLKVTAPAKVIPDGVSVIDISVQNTPDIPPEAFVTDPFAVYKDNAQCWHKALSNKSDTEYQAIELAKTEARKKFLSDNNISETDQKNKNYPIVFDSTLLYDKVNKIYYTWLDVRAPIKGGTESSCNLKVIAPPKALFSKTKQSTKPDPFAGKYITDNTYYRVHDSAVAPDYYDARNNAINNALIQMQGLKGLDNVSQISYRIIDELYYPKDGSTGNYDYWVAIESKK